ncbi:hypothetical protein PARPLA_03218 [Rhodobacteraceae bacterium THAF1]|uniref:hypothetical protein n=1 Tax=Palleronia sp. THAF1 TaxID=2587842 RepID=UPI000F3E04D4|nr:hypothetical protein [Palleronia sp. THAF1]QFU08622.1 hypothetical protein FIU81_08045 [Palleronia sp. THAF1]VDC30740.1 hypothetical protein PARPLA_03218 [Rhodobacteraceae bacterium THAF1]
MDRTPNFAWGPVQRASFGLIYGAILVLSLLMAMDEVRDGAFEAALVLFGSVLAVTLAKIFAEVLSHAMETGERILTAKAFRTAWRHSHPTLLVANVPTAIFAVAGLDWLDVSTATALSQAFCILVLVVLGARVGWVINHSWWLPIGGAAFAGSVGVGLAAMKYAIH